jgi:hypothetical protein
MHKVLDFFVQWQSVFKASPAPSIAADGGHYLVCVLRLEHCECMHAEWSFCFWLIA